MASQELRIPAELAGTKELVTAAFQKVLDCARDTPGAVRVVVPAGDYRIGSVRIYSDTELHLEEDAHLIGSDDIADYTDWGVPTTMGIVTQSNAAFLETMGHATSYVNALITMADAQNVSVTGERGSLIDGVDCFDPNGEEGFRGAMGMRICRCRNVVLNGYTFTRAANWSHQIDSSENLLFENVHIEAGHDGFHMHHCNNAVIRDCSISTGDDCIAGIDNHNVIVEHCELNTACNAFRFGGSNLFVSKCHVFGPGKYEHHLEGSCNMHSAVKHFSPDGDTMRENSCSWRFVDCVIENVGRFIHVDHGSAKGYQVNLPLEDVHFEHVKTTGFTLSSFFRGSEDVPGTLGFKDCTFEYTPDQANAGKPFVQLGDGAKLESEETSYTATSGEPFSGPRVVLPEEVEYHVLKKDMSGR